MSQSNIKKILPLEVKRSLSKDNILPGNTINVQILISNTTQHPIESLYITEGEIQPSNEVELFPVTEIDSLQFIHQGIIFNNAQHSFQYSITLHPFSSSEHISIEDMQVSFNVKGIPTQVTVPGTKIIVGNIPIEELEISEGHYSCPNCAEHLEFDTVLCTNCGFEINQETLHKIWSNHQTHQKLIEEEFIQANVEPIHMEEPTQIEENSILNVEKEHADERSVILEEKTSEAEKIPANMEIMYLKQAAQAFQEDRCEECLLNLKITLQIIEDNNPTVFQNTNDVLGKLLRNIREFSGQSVSNRTAATSLKFVISFIKSLKKEY
ncbi:MAG: hypothetical protein ACW963_03420 [Candidatus Sifarchaeia archaeon]